MTGRVQKRVLLLVTAAVLLGGALAGAYAIKQAHTKKLMTQWLSEGMAAYKEGQYQEAMEKLGKFAGRDRTHEDVILALADSRRRTPMESGRQLVEAVKFAKLAADLAPDDLAPREMLLEIYEQLGYVTERTRVAEEILAAHPDNKKAMEALVVCLAQVGKTKESFEQSERLVKAYPEDAVDQWRHIELMAMTSRPPAEILQHADEIANRFPNDPRIIVIQARAHAMAKDAKGALDLARKAAGMKVTSADGLSDLLKLLDDLSPDDASFATAADDVLKREMNGPIAGQVAAVAAERSWKAGHPDAAREFAAKGFDAAHPGKEADTAALGWWLFLGVASGTAIDDASLQPVLTELQNRDNPHPGYFWIDLAKGTSELNSGNLSGASEKFSLARAADYLPELPDYLLGDVRQRQGEWRQAAIIWKSLSKSQPSWRVVRLSLVTLLLQHDQIEDAVKYAEYAFKARRSGPEALALTRALLAMLESGRADDKQVEEALAVADSLALDSKDESPAQCLAARIYFAAAKPDKGLPIVRSVMSAKAAPPQDQLAALANATRPFDAALADQVFAMARAGGDSPGTALEAATQLAAQGKQDEGRKLLEQAVKSHQGPAKVDFELRLAAYLDTTGDKGAAAEFDRIAKDNPDNAVVQQALLDSRSAWSDQNIVSAAIGRLKAISGPSGSVWKLYEARRLVAFEPDKGAPDAVKYLGDVIRQDPKNAGALALNAEALLLLDDRSQAIEYLGRAVDTNENRPTFYPRLIQLLQQAGASEEAQRRLIAFSKIQELPPSMLRTRARLLSLQAMWDLSAKDFAQLEKLGDPSDRLALAIALSRKGDVDKARQTMEELVKSPKLDEPIVVAAANFFANIGDADKGLEVLTKDLPQEAANHRAAILAAYLERCHRFDQAEQQYIEQAKDGKAESQAELAKFYYKRGKFDQASAVVAAGLKNFPDNPALKQMQGFVSLSTGKNTGEALSEITAALDSSQASGPLSKLADIFKAANEHPSEVATYISSLEKLTSENPTFYPAWKLLVKARLDRGEIKSAVDAARNAVSSIPVDPRPAQLATEVMTAAGQYDEALRMGNEWRQRTITEPFEAEMGIAVVNAAANNYDEGLRRVQPWKDRILAEAAEYPEHLQLYATLLAHTGHMKEAEDAVWPRAQKDPQWALRCLSIAADLTGPDRERWTLQVAPSMEKTAANQYDLGRLFFDIARKDPSSERFTRAVDSLTAAFQDPKFKGPAAVFLAACNESMGNREEAIRYYKIAREQDPNDAAVANNLAYILASDATKTADVSDAVTLARSAVELGKTKMLPLSQQSSFYDTLGFALVQSGKLEEAEKAFRDGLGIAPDSLDLQLGLAEVQLAQGSPDRARSLLSRLDQSPASNQLSKDLQRRVDSLKAKLAASK